MSAGKPELPQPDDIALLREQAWIGDAVLALYARRWIVANAPADADRSELFRRMTCNHFLSALGEPTKVEARIGRIFEAEGLDAACAWMEREVLPMYLKQTNRSHTGGRRSGRQD
ncbi:MAG: ribonuclease III domain-containing protein [Opitutales bacterium]|jgi:hypothetical protein